MSQQQPMPPEPGARRLMTMLRHSTHTFVALLWLVGCWRAPLRSAGPLHWALALGLPIAYLAGLAVQQRRRGSSARERRRTGLVWVGTLLALWAVLTGLAASWVWLCFPLLFLVLFIVPSPWRWVGVLAATAWAAFSPLVRGEHLGVGTVLGPVLGAAFAAVACLVLEQLQADVATQRRLTDEVAQARAEAAAAETREALARDLHDTLAQGLNSIVLLARTTRAQHPQAAAELTVIEDTARENLAQARAMLRDLTDSDATALTDQLATLVAETNRREQALGTGLVCELRTDGQPRRVAAQIGQAAQMAARSLLANVSRHAGASRCVVGLTWFDDELHLDVADDGVGFEPAAGARGFGLTALADRVEQLGGSLDVRSAPGEGTTVAMSLPTTATSPGGSR